MSNETFQTSTQDSSSLTQQNEQLFSFVKDSITSEIDSKFEELKPGIDEKINNLVSEFSDDVRDNLKETKDELNTVKNNVINTLAIFAAFFTFISTSFNIFSNNISIFSALSLVVTLWLLLIGFAYLVGVFVSREHNHIKAWVPVIALASLSCLILWFNYEKKPQTTQTQNTSNGVAIDRNKADTTTE